MTGPAAHPAIALDITTLFVVAACVTALLGLFLLSAWRQDRVRALAWWGCAYLIGAASVALWGIESMISPPMPPGFANALVFISCGMIWSAARLFHGRPVLWGTLALGATVWLIACLVPAFVESLAARIVLSSLIVATYTFLTSAELWRERRRRLMRRWPTIFVPILHGLIFLCPIPLAAVLPSDGGVVSLASGWIAVFGLETMLYVVGTAFVGLAAAKEHVVRIHKDAAATDELTGLLNRRGFLQAAQVMIAEQGRSREPVSVLMFDLDHFKRVNDRHGHVIGDETLRLFAAIASASLRTTDILGRLGGEEFVAILPSKTEDAGVAAERVRGAFQAAAATVGGCTLDATVSVGIASGTPGTEVTILLARADTALYRAKSNGRNRVEIAVDGPAAHMPPAPVVRRADRAAPAEMPVAQSAA